MTTVDTNALSGLINPVKVRPTAANSGHSNFRMNFAPFEQTQMKPGQLPLSSKKYDPALPNYNRQFRFGPGADDLVNIAAGLHKGFARVDDAITLPEAQSSELDITGPNGKPDGIPEVFVTGSKGNLKVINGWRLTNSDYGKRRAYHTMIPDKKQRQEDGNSFQDFKEKYLTVTDDGTGNPAYANPLPGRLGEALQNTKDVSAKKFFNDAIYKATCDANKSLVEKLFASYGWQKNPKDPSEIKKAKAFNKAKSKSQGGNLAYLALVKLAVYRSLNKEYGLNSFRIEAQNKIGTRGGSKDEVIEKAERIRKSFESSKIFKNAAQQVVMNLVNNFRSANRDQIVNVCMAALNY